MPNELTKEDVELLLSYDATTGHMTWRVDRGKGRAGERAGTRHPHGYRQIKLKGRLYLTHRLAWLLMTGAWPRHTVDHINGDRTDDRFENLRDVPQGINSQNRRKPQRNNTTGFLGVTERQGRFRAAVQSPSGKTHAAGSYATAEEAHAAYIDKKRELHEGCTI